MAVDCRAAYHGVTKDIGQSSAFITTKGPFRPGQKLVLDFCPPKLKYEKRVGNIFRIVQEGMGLNLTTPCITSFPTRCLNRSIHL